MSLEYLRAVEDIADDSPIAFDEATVLIYFRFLDVGDVLHKVIDTSERVEVRSWGKRGLGRKRPTEATKNMLCTLQGHNIPFGLYSAEARVYQVGCNSGTPPALVTDSTSLRLRTSPFSVNPSG